jgi:D-3-phosphoglycerate dehydrogenase
LNKDTLAKTKKGVRMINCARGGIVDEKALIEAVQSGHVKGAALDVFEKEPLDPQSPLLKIPEIILTPHLGASTEEAQVKVALELSQSCVDFFQNGFARQAVNLPPLDVAGQNAAVGFCGVGVQAGALFGAGGRGGPDAFKHALFRGIGSGQPGSLHGHGGGGIFNGDGRERHAVNALLLAQQKGLQIQEQVHPEAKDYASLLEMEADDGRRDTHVGGNGLWKGRSAVCAD